MTQPRRGAGPRSALGLLLAAFGPVLPGCGGEPKTYPVSGTVTWNGEPLPAGDVYFRPADPGGGTEAGKVVAGRFRFRARPGKKRVEIRASRLVPGRKTPMGSPLRLEYIPPRYNDQSTLSAEVSPGGGNEYEFKLEGKDR